VRQKETRRSGQIDPEFVRHRVMKSVKAVINIRSTSEQRNRKEFVSIAQISTSILFGLPNGRPGIQRDAKDTGHNHENTAEIFTFKVYASDAVR
jgi:hypothetical protein